MGRRRGPESLEVAGGACSRPLGAILGLVGGEARSPDQAALGSWAKSCQPPRPWVTRPPQPLALSCQPSPSSVFVSPDVPLLRKLFSGAASSTHLSTHSQLKDLPQVQYTVLGFVLKL